MSLFNIDKIIKKIKCETGYKKPDLVLYYSILRDNNNDGSNNTAIIEGMSIGNTTLFATFYGTIFNDYELSTPIGKYTGNAFIYGINNPNENHLYEEKNKICSAVAKL